MHPHAFPMQALWRIWARRCRARPARRTWRAAGALERACAAPTPTFQARRRDARAAKRGAASQCNVRGSRAPAAVLCSAARAWDAPERVVPMVAPQPNRSPLLRRCRWPLMASGVMGAAGRPPPPGSSGQFDYTLPPTSSPALLPLASAVPPESRAARLSRSLRRAAPVTLAVAAGSVGLAYVGRHRRAERRRNAEELALRVASSAEASSSRRCDPQRLAAARACSRSRSRSARRVRLQAEAPSERAVARF